MNRPHVMVHATCLVRHLVTPEFLITPGGWALGRVQVFILMESYRENSAPPSSNLNC